MPIDQTLRGLALEIDATTEPAPETQPLLEYRFINLANTQTILARIKGIPRPDGGGQLAFETNAGADTTTHRMLVDDKGNVGIGTENPEARLDVVGDAKLSGPLSVQGALTASGDAIIGGHMDVVGDAKLSGPLSVQGALTASGDAIIAGRLDVAGDATFNGSLTIDGALSASGLNLNGVAAIDGNLSVTGTLTAASLTGNGEGLSNVTPADASVTSAKLAQDATSLSKVSAGAIIVSGGNVGIGTTSPDKPLAIKAVGTSQELIGFKDPSGATRWHINQNLVGAFPGLNFVESGVADGRLFLKTGGNVGIGTISPQRKLQIGDDVIGLSFDPGTSPNAGVLRFGDNTGWRLHFGRSRERSGGALNSGTTGLLMTIQDNGNVIVQGTVNARNFPTTSDANYKTNITPLTNVLGKLDKVRGIAFSWNGLYESENHCAGAREIGVIAQEVETVFPELVTTWDKGRKAVDYGRFSAVLLEAVKELKANVEGLAQKIAPLQSEENAQLHQP